MNRTGKVVSWTVWIGVALTAVLLGLALFLLKLQRTGPPQLLPVIGTVPAFNLTNHLGKPVTRETLSGHVWVADIIFTRCAGPCPVMTRQMRELQDALPASSGARLITLTTDADYDTVAVLKKESERVGANPDRWNFLTGDKVAIANLAIDGLKLTAIAKKPEERVNPSDLFVHSTIFVIVDKRGQLRGSFLTQDETTDWSQSKLRIIAAVNQLENEP